VKRGHYWVAGAAAGWALVFAVFHIVWAAGWYPLLDAEQARLAFATPWKWAFDVVVAIMCVVAVPVALALGTPLGERVPRRVFVNAAWVGTSLLVLRAAASLVQAIYELSSGRFSLERLGIWEPWFYIGALLFSVNLWMYSRRARSGVSQLMSTTSQERGEGRSRRP
jgi:hypothetical protein